MTGAEWLVVPGVGLFVVGWVFLDRANTGASRASRNSMYLALTGFLMAFAGLLVAMLGVRAFDDQSGCEEGMAVDAGGNYCSDFHGG